MSDEGSSDENTDKGVGNDPKGAERPEDSLISITVTYCNENYPFELDKDTTIGELKPKLEFLTDVPVHKQKLIYKETLRDDMKIKDINITEKKRKIMLMGTKRDRSSPVQQYSKPENAIHAVDTPLPLDEGETLTGLLDYRGKPLRMRFEQGTKRLFLATSSSTHRIPLSSIEEFDVIPTEEDENYFILKLKAFMGGGIRKMQIHWIPRQYIQDIQDKIRKR
ncbi:hypothetical protein Aperf_G00000032647 [Anoplocephala perfoliata]